MREIRKIVSLVLIFWVGFLVRGFRPPVYIAPIHVYAPHDTAAVLIRFGGDELHCFMLD